MKIKIRDWFNPPNDESLFSAIKAYLNAFGASIRAAYWHGAFKSYHNLDDKNIQSPVSLISEVHIYFTRTNWAYASLHHNVHYWDNTHKYSQFRTQHNVGRSRTKNTRPYDTYKQNTTRRKSLLIVPSFWFAYVQEMWKSPGLHSTVYQPTQTHKLHWLMP